jgi:hypothetical protein
VVPPFAEYWKPPTDSYGQPVRGGTLRWIYEDPLEHANAWGASAGPADRMRILTAVGSPVDTIVPGETAEVFAGEFGVIEHNPGLPTRASAYGYYVVAYPE